MNPSAAAIPHFRDEIIGLMVDLFFIAAGYAIYLILIIFCLRFIIFDIRGRSRARTVLLSFVSLSIVATSVDLLVQYVSSTSLLLCSLASDTPIPACNNPATDKTALHRNIANAVAGIILNILADGMLFYRALIIWQRNLLIALPTAVFFIAVEAFQIYAQTVFLNPHGTTSMTFADNINAASYSLPAFYDVIVSALIIWRLLQYRRNAKAAESRESIAVYTSLAAIFFEASLLLSSARIIYAGVLLTHKKWIGAFWAQDFVDIAAAISPLFIILRLALHSFVDPYSSTMERRDASAELRREAGLGTENTLSMILKGETQHADAAERMNGVTYAGKMTRGEDESEIGLAR